MLRRKGGVHRLLTCHWHEERMHTKPALKRWFLAAVQTASQLGWTTAKEPPDARISDLTVVMLAFGQQTYTFQATSLPRKAATLQDLCTQVPGTRITTISKVGQPTSGHK
jgi:hypothetical protein